MSAPGRAATLGALARLGPGADAKAILTEARLTRPGLGQATVFRALRALQEAGLVLRYFDAKGVRRFILPAPHRRLDGERRYGDRRPAG